MFRPERFGAIDGLVQERLGKYTFGACSRMSDESQSSIDAMEIANLAHLAICTTYQLEWKIVRGAVFGLGEGRIKSGYRGNTHGDNVDVDSVEPAGIPTCSRDRYGRRSTLSPR